MKLQKQLVLAFCALFSLNPLTCVGQGTLATEILSAHNKSRAEVGVKPLAWSDTLAQSARQWANFLNNERGCTLQHSSNKLGENLFWASPVRWSDGNWELLGLTPSQVVRGWADEKHHYNQLEQSCKPGKVCGHYTQIVWANTKRVGCAYSVCRDKAQIWVCQYDPPGNYVGRKPF